MRMIFSSCGRSDISLSGAEPLGVPVHAHERAEAAGVAEAQRGQVENDGPAVPVDSVLRISECPLRRGEVELTGEGKGDLVRRGHLAAEREELTRLATDAEGATTHR
jgi:hypothetical protein